MVFILLERALLKTVNPLINHNLI